MVRPCPPCQHRILAGALLWISQTPLVSSLGKRGGHSDNGKFCRRLRRPQGCKVSERSLFALQNSSTSNLTTGRRDVGILLDLPSAFKNADRLYLVGASVEEPNDEGQKTHHNSISFCVLALQYIRACNHGSS